MRNIPRKALTFLLSVSAAAFLSCSGSNPSSSGGNNNGGNQTVNREPRILGIDATISYDTRELMSGTYMIVSAQISDPDGDTMMYSFEETGGTKRGSFYSSAGSAKGNELIGTKYTAPSGISVKELHTITLRVSDGYRETTGRLDFFVVPYR